MKLCSRLLLGFGRNFCEKNYKFGYANPTLGKLGMAHDLGRWLVEKVDFLFALTEVFFAFGFEVIRRNVYSLAVFTEGRPLCTQILLG